MREKQWKQYQSMAFLTTRIFDKTLGIAGLQKTRLAKKAAKGCEWDLYEADPTFARRKKTQLNVEWREMENLFRDADIVALTPTLTRARARRERSLSLMKPTAILINTSRGRGREKALAKALKVKDELKAPARMFLNGLSPIRTPVHFPVSWIFLTSSSLPTLEVRPERQERPWL